MTYIIYIYYNDISKGKPHENLEIERHWQVSGTVATLIDHSSMKRLIIQFHNTSFKYLI